MEVFTLALALGDMIPVLAFGSSVWILGHRFNSPLFMAAAFVFVLAGCCKVAWKLTLVLKKRDLVWLERLSLPVLGTGFLMVLVSLYRGYRQFSWSNIFCAATSFPAVILFMGWGVMMCAVIWYGLFKFRRTDAASNRTMLILNTVGQIYLLLGVLFSRL